MFHIMLQTSFAHVDCQMYLHCLDVILPAKRTSVGIQMSNTTLEASHRSLEVHNSVLGMFCAKPTCQPCCTLTCVHTEALVFTVQVTWRHVRCVPLIGSGTSIVWCHGSLWADSFTSIAHTLSQRAHLIPSFELNSGNNNHTELHV